MLAIEPGAFRSRSEALMLFVQCPFCHKKVLRFFYAKHRTQHTTPLADGQMTDHVTVHPTGRYKGSLAGVPQSYQHSLCGVVTGMPEEIIRSYLANPFLYSDKSFCCGCNDYVSKNELCWVETGQKLTDYTMQLRQEYLR